MRLLGYTSAFSVRPGEGLDFMLSCEPAGEVAVQIERVICGDPNPKGPGLKTAEVGTAADGVYSIKPQPIRVGSHVEIPPTARLNGIQNLSLAAIFWPTLHKAERQSLLSIADGRSEISLELRNGRLGLAVQIAGRDYWLEAGAQLHLQRWYRAFATVSADGRCRVVLEPIEAETSPFDRVEAEAEFPWEPFWTDVSITVAARRSERGAVSHFNGRIEAPRLETGAGPKRQTLAAWDFAVGIDTADAHDRSASGLHGRVVNLPTRAVRGHLWDGRFQDWRDCPGQYAAIHFHEDDLYDAGWRPDVRWRVPADFASGLYAARLTCGDVVYRLPFVVGSHAPGRSAALALLLPTASYYAYANDHCHLEGANPQMLTGRLLRLRELDLVLASRGDLGLSLYDRHCDGSGNHFSSRLRPILNMAVGHATWIGGPGSGLWQLGADTHIIDWLETCGFPYEIITDEELHREGIDLLSNYRVVMTGTHPEYYSTAMWDGVDAYLKAGGRLIYMGGNGFYWRIGFSDRFPGAIEVRRAEDGTRSWAAEPGEYHHQFDGAYGGLWRRNGRPPQQLVGVGFTAQGFGESTHFVRTPASYDEDVAFIFEGVQDEEIGNFGLIGDGAAGLELDRHDPLLGSPETSKVVCTSAGHGDLFILANEEVGVNRPNVKGEESPLVRADVVFTRLRSGGAVFATGSIAWSGSLFHNSYRNNVSQITRNVLNRFLQA